MRQHIFLVLLLAVATAAAGQGGSSDANARNAIPLEVDPRFGAILVRVHVNGQSALMIVDTGSSNTIVSSDLLHVRPLALEHADTAAKGSGYRGSAAWAKATVELGDLRWPDRKVLVMDDFREISHSMKQKIDGILGEDLLQEFSSVLIDFKHQRLFVSRAERSP